MYARVSYEGMRGDREGKGRDGRWKNYVSVLKLYEKTVRGGMRGGGEEKEMKGQ